MKYEVDIVYKDGQSINYICGWCPIFNDEGWIILNLNESEVIYFNKEDISSMYVNRIKDE